MERLYESCVLAYMGSKAIRHVEEGGLDPGVARLLGLEGDANDTGFRQDGLDNDLPTPTRVEFKSELAQRLNEQRLKSEDPQVAK